MTPGARSLQSVGLDLVFLRPGSAGIGRYGFELLAALAELDDAPALTAFVSPEAPSELFEQPWSERIEWVRAPFSDANRLSVPYRQLVIPRKARRRRLDVLHSPANVGPLVAPGVANVVTIHDIIWLHQREQWETGLAARMLGVLVRASARTANRLITDSEASRDDLVGTLGAKPDRVDVVPLGVRQDRRIEPLPDDELRTRLDLGARPIVLCVAQKRPYKNLAALVRALPELPDAALVIPGRRTAYEDELRALAHALGVADRVRLPEWVSEEELEGLYTAASCFVLPSLIEGFGLPALEAMARGLPVACSNRPSLPEVVGDAALLFDPADQAAVNNAIRRLLTDAALASQVAERGRERSKRFSWRRTAEETLASYRRALGQ